MIVVFIGVIFWISREREEDEEMREEAGKLQRGRRKGHLVKNKCIHEEDLKDIEDMIDFK